MKHINFLKKNLLRLVVNAKSIVELSQVVNFLGLYQFSKVTGDLVGWVAVRPRVILKATSAERLSEGVSFKNPLGRRKTQTKAHSSPHVMLTKTNDSETQRTLSN